MSPHHVLIVEDDPLVSGHIESIVTRTVTAEVVVATSVAEAGAALAKPPHFAFLDVDVLDGTTYAFASTLQARGVPFAFVSASNRNNIPEKLRAAPFVAKPYTEGDIARTVKTGLAGRRPQAAPVAELRVASRPSP